MEKVPIHEKIRLIRVNLGWSQAELAKHVDRSTGTVCKYETGETVPPGDVLEMIYDLKDQITGVELNF